MKIDTKKLPSSARAAVERAVDGTKTALVQMRLTPSMKERWLRAAQARGLTLSEWIVERCEK